MMRNKSVFIVSLLLLNKSLLFSQEGKVGVNNETPTETLDVNGTLRVRDIPLSTVGKIYNGNTNKSTLFTGTRTLVVNNDGVVGYVDGLPNINNAGNGIVYTAGRGISISSSNVISRTGLEEVTEGGNQGWRLIGVNANNYGNIGYKALDLSYSDGASETRGATGGYSTAIGFGNTSSGDYSFSSGYESISSGRYSFSSGNSNQSTGENSFAVGNRNLASGHSSFVLGSRNTASGHQSFVLGDSSEASGINAAVMGVRSQAKGRNSLVIGFESVTEADAQGAVVIGAGSKATKQNAIAIGDSNDASGYGSLAMGKGNITNYGFNIALGEYNHPKDEFLVSVGNGEGVTDDKRSNALVVTRQGKVGVGLKQESPKESIDTNGAIKIGTTQEYSVSSSLQDGATTPVPDGGAGTIIFQNGHFYGWTGTAWKQLDN